MNEYEITNEWKACTYTFLADDDETAALMLFVWNDSLLSYFVKNVDGNIIAPKLEAKCPEKWYEKKYKKTVMDGSREKKEILYRALASMRIKESEKYYYSKSKREKFLMLAEKEKENE